MLTCLDVWDFGSGFGSPSCRRVRRRGAVSVVRLFSASPPAARRLPSGRGRQRAANSPAGAMSAPKDPNLKKWSAHLIGGKKVQLLGFVEAVSEPAAIESAVASFRLDDQKRRRLAVNLRR